MQDKPKQPPPTRPHRHNFTEKQRRHLQPVIDQGRQLNQQISWFMNFVMDEADLPKAVEGYALQFDQDGTPFMLGMVPVAEEPSSK